MTTITTSPATTVPPIDAAGETPPGAASQLALAVLETGALEAALVETLEGLAANGGDISSIDLMRLGLQTSALQVHTATVSSACKAFFDPLKELAEKL